MRNSRLNLKDDDGLFSLPGVLYATSINRDRVGTPQLFARPLAQVMAGRIEHLNPPVSSIGNVHVA